MRYFFAQSIAVVVALVILYMVPGDRVSYFASILDKVERLRKAASPRLIVVGGSAAAFAVDGEELVRASGREVINLGIHASVGLEFNLRMAHQWAKSGDIILLMPEVENFIKGSSYNSYTLGAVLNEFPGGILYLSLQQMRSMFYGMPSLFTTKTLMIAKRLFALVGVSGLKTGRCFEGIYCRSSFDKYGSIAEEFLKSESVSPLSSPITFKEWDLEVFRSLKNIVNELDRKNVKSLIVFPPISASQYALNQDLILRLRQSLLHEGLETRLPDLSERRNVLPDAAFLDTTYHVNQIGRKQFMNYLLQLLGSL